MFWRCHTRRGVFLVNGMGCAILGIHYCIFLQILIVFQSRNQLGAFSLVWYAGPDFTPFPVPGIALTQILMSLASAWWGWQMHSCLLTPIARLEVISMFVVNLKPLPENRGLDYMPYLHALGLDESAGWAMNAMYSVHARTFRRGGEGNRRPRETVWGVTSSTFETRRLWYGGTYEVSLPIRRVTSKTFIYLRNVSEIAAQQALKLL